MQQLTVSPIHLTDKNIRAIAAFMDSLPKHALDAVPWPQFPYKPQVAFSIAYDAAAVCVKFFVEEAFIKAAHGRTNAAVYEDACVEFFISLDDGATYYNIEANCIGAVLVGFGTGRESRILLPPALVDTIGRHVVISQNRSEAVVWEQTLVIPFELFIHHSRARLEGRTCRANFYKCGDGLPQPHFIAWNNIESSEPDFHQPQYFGALHFAR